MQAGVELLEPSRSAVGRIHGGDSTVKLLATSTKAPTSYLPHDPQFTLSYLPKRNVDTGPPKHRTRMFQIRYRHPIPEKPQTSIRGWTTAILSHTREWRVEEAEKFMNRQNYLMVKVFCWRCCNGTDRVPPRAGNVRKGITHGSGGLESGITPGAGGFR